MIGPWELTAAITTYTVSGFVTVQPQSLGDDGGLGYMVAHHPYGFRGRPLDGEDGSSSGSVVLIGFEGDRGHAWILEDGRVLPKLPDEGPGGSLQYATTADGKISYFMLKADGTATLRVDDASGPIRLEHGTTGPHVEVGETAVELGGEPGVAGGAVYDPGGALATWIAAVSAATGVPPPGATVVSATVKIKP